MTGNASSAPAIPPRAKAPLVWLEREPGSMGCRTECGWYSCCEIHQGDKVTLEVWTREPLTSGMRQLAVGLSSWEEARGIAQADADKAGA